MDKKAKNRPLKKNPEYVTRTFGASLKEDDANAFIDWIEENRLKIGAEVGKLIAKKVEEIKKK